MLPIAELSVKEARHVCGVCFDVDDTITKEGVLDPGAFSALHRLRRAGLHLVAATGRPLAWAELFARMWPIDAAVGENGAGWYYKRDGRLQEGHPSPPEVRSAQRQRLLQLRDLIRERLPEVRETSDSWGRRCDLAFDVGENVKLPPEKIASLVALIESSGARSVVSTVHAHATFDDTDKARGIEGALRDALGIELGPERARWLFVGDSGNDAAAFTWFPLCAGVANVRNFLPQLPVPPRYVATSECGRGFTEIADTLLSRRDEAPD